MMLPTLPDLPDRLRAEKDEIARDAIGRLYGRHPGLDARFGATGRRACLEDLQHHVEQLAAALETGSSAAFHAYLRWVATVLEHRGIARAHLAESLQDLEASLTARLSGGERAQLAPLVAAGVAQLQNPAPAPLHRFLRAPLPTAEPFAKALLAGDRRTAQQIALAHLDRGDSLTRLYARVIQPSLYRVGQLWQENRISVAQEHLATAVAQHIMAVAYAHTEFAPPHGGRALFACVENNHHAVGLRMVSDTFEQAGWEVGYLGADVPTGALVAQVQSFRPELVALSVSQVQQLSLARAAVADLRRATGENCPQILVGGILLNQAEALWQELGADTWLPDLEAVAEWLS